MKLKRLIAFISAMSIIASSVGIAYAEETEVEQAVAINEPVYSWGNSDIALGYDFGVVTKSDGTCYITDSSYDNINFKRSFNTGKTVKVSVPSDLPISSSYALILTDGGKVKGYNFNSSDLTAHSTQISTSRVDSGAVDVFTTDSKGVVLMEDGSVIYTPNNDRGSTDIYYYVDNLDGAGETVTETVTETVYAPEEDVKNFKNMKKLDVEIDYILGLTKDGEVELSNSCEMIAEVSGDAMSYDKPTVTWQQSWEVSDVPDEMDTIEKEVEQLTNVKDVDGNKNFIVYVDNEGTCGMLGGEIYGLSDEVISWKNIEKIKSFAEGTQALVVGIKDNGSIVTTTYGASILLEGTHTSQLQELADIHDAVDVDIHSANGVYSIVVKHEDLTYTSVEVGGNMDWLQSIEGSKYDLTIPIEHEILFENSIRKVAFKLSNEYNTGYKLYIKEKDELSKVEVNSEYEYTEPMRINSDTTYEYIIAKKMTDDLMVASPVYDIRVRLSSNEPTIVPDITSGIVKIGSNIKLHTEFNGETLDNFAIQYVKVDQQDNDIISKIVGQTLDEVLNSSDIDVTTLISNDNIKTYSDIEGISIDKNCDIFVWGIDNNGEEPVQGSISSLRYTALMQRPNIYPTEEYKSVYSEAEREDIANGYKVTRRNTMMVKAGSYMSAALASNGEVWSSKISTVSNSGMDIPIQYVSSVPYSEDSTDWLATRMWRMISDIAVGESHVVGLRIDGTVIASGNNAKNQCDVSDWTGIVDIAAGKDHTVGLKKTGEVVGTAPVQGDAEDYGQTEFSTWMYKYDESLTEEENKALEKEQRIVAIEANNNNTIGLRNNGTVVVAGNNDNGQCNVDSWTDIVDIAMGTRHAVGLKSDGTVVATGDNGYGQCNVKNWKDVVQISASAYETVGITYDGRVLSTYNNAEGCILIYGAQDELVDIQSGLKGFIGTYNSSTGNFDLTSSEWFNSVNFKSTDSYGQTMYLDSSYSNTDNRINVYNRLNNMYDNGIKFKYISSGNYTTIVVDEQGVVYNIIHSTGPDSPDDLGYPIIGIDNEAYAPILDRGPTIINNYYNGFYNKELDIKLSSTTGEENNILWSLDNTDVYAMGTNSTTLTFDNAQVLNIAPYKLVGTRKINYPEIKYMYQLGEPNIIFSKSGAVKKGTQVAISTTRPQRYKVYYTTDGSMPTLVNSDNGYVPNSSTIEYTGAITIDESVKLMAMAYDIDDVYTYTEVHEASFIVTDGELGNTGTLVESSMINEDTIFTRQGSPYNIVNNLTIASGASLSIEPGVVINVADDKRITVNGNLVSYGTEEEPVKFTSEGKWFGILINSQSGNNSNVLKNIDISKSFMGMTVNTESTRIVDGLQNITLHDNDSGLNVQSDNLVINSVKAYNNVNGFGISISGENTTVNNCTLTGNNIGININCLNCTVTNCNISENATYGVFLDGGADSLMNNTVVNYNTIKDNHSINKETGEKSGYNVGCADAVWLYQMEVDFKNNYWGTRDLAEIMSTLHPVNQSPIFLLDGYDNEENCFAELNIQKAYVNSNGDIVDGIDGATKIVVTVGKINGTASKLPIIIVGYNDKNEMVTLEINDYNMIDSEEVEYTVELNGATTVKVLAWESLQSLKPVL